MRMAALLPQAPLPAVAAQDGICGEVEVWAWNIAAGAIKG